MNKYLIGSVVYTSLAQGVLAQANYFRDQYKIPEYKKTTFLPDINNENKVNPDYTKRMESLNKMVLVKASSDSMVIPNDSEWYGFYKDNSSDKWTMEESPYYDLFGLKTLNEAKKIDFYTTPGDHLQFTQAFYFQMADKYLKN